MNIFLSVIGGVVGLSGLWAMVIVLLQDLRVVPALLNRRYEIDKIPSTNLLSVYRLATAPGVEIDVWECQPLTSKKVDKQVPLIFNHGNGHTNDSFWSIQKKFSELGFYTYSYDYRGVSHSTGWPSEAALENDAMKVLEHIANKHGIEPEKVIIVGISLGCGPACYLVEKFQTRRLLLYTPYVSLPVLVSGMSGVSLLARFVWYRFENKMRLTKWFVNGYSCNKSGCEINRADIKVTPGDRIEKDLVVVHSKDDQVIPFAHSVNIVSNVTSLIEQSSLPNALRVRFVQLKSAYHDQIVDQSWDEVVPVLREWLSGES